MDSVSFVRDIYISEFIDDWTVEIIDSDRQWNLTNSNIVAADIIKLFINIQVIQYVFSSVAANQRFLVIQRGLDTLGNNCIQFINYNGANTKVPFTGAPEARVNLDIRLYN